MTINRKAKVKARKLSEKSEISPLLGPEVKSPICWGTWPWRRKKNLFSVTKEIVESEDISSLSSRPSNKSINDHSSLSECEGAQTCLFEQYHSEWTKLGYWLDTRVRRGATIQIGIKANMRCCIANSVHYWSTVWLNFRENEIILAVNYTSDGVAMFSLSIISI